MMIKGTGTNEAPKISLGYSQDIVFEFKGNEMGESIFVTHKFHNVKNYSGSTDNKYHDGIEYLIKVICREQEQPIDNLISINDNYIYRTGTQYENKKSLVKAFTLSVQDDSDSYPLYGEHKESENNSGDITECICFEPAKDEKVTLMEEDFNSGDEEGDGVDFKGLEEILMNKGHGNSWSSIEERDINFEYTEIKYVGVGSDGGWGCENDSGLLHYLY